MRYCARRCSESPDRQGQPHGATEAVHPGAAMPPSALSEVLLVERRPIHGEVGRSSRSGLLHLT
jgi:hypothetical protein